MGSFVQAGNMTNFEKIKRLNGKWHVVFVFMLFIVCVQCTNHSQLSTIQKVRDFEFLYQTLEENYPFFGVTKRQTNIDWLSKKSEYLRRIENTPNDSAYYMTVTSIVNELRCPHLHVALNHEMMLDVYKRATLEKPKYAKYAKWVEVLEKSKKQSIYWQKIWNKYVAGYTKQKGISSVLINPNIDKYVAGYAKQTSQTQTHEIFYSDSILIEDKIAIMRIQSFLYDNLANDSVKIISFLEKIKDCDNLIIDIQDNEGGSSNYWKNYIVGKISDTTITFPRNQVVKDGSLNRHFCPEIDEWHIVTKQNTFFPNMPDEIFDGSYYLSSYTDTIIPENPIPFKGNIYLLVNNFVVSSSDDFAYFCKVSKWATVAGIRTRGEGANSGEPTLFMLPNSGIVLRHPSLAGLNEDGSFSFETRTAPNIEIEAKNSDERLGKLINLIKSKV